MRREADEAEMVNNYKRLLMLAPHTDDVELGCGGTVARFVEEKECEINVAVFSTAGESVPKGFPRTALRDEFYEAMKILGVRKDHLHVYDYSVRKLSYSRQAVLEELVKLGRSIKPDMVFLPSSQDLHQDHQTLCNEGLRAFKEITLWGYELPWNTITFPTRGFITLEKRHLERKWKALLEYKTQFAAKRPYFSRDYIMGIAKVRGLQVKSKYAEAFDVLRVKW
ncbi:MAG TPA: PIG-L deacetylase family protein [Nitrososphaerales archaeon]|nr:PIG-L deacetylase family protein [Nitrososphaerales archaeon]